MRSQLTRLNELAFDPINRETAQRLAIGMRGDYLEAVGELRNRYNRVPFDWS